jgi:cation transport ATPase
MYCTETDGPFQLSTATMRNFRQNLILAFGNNTIGIPIAAGVLYPINGLTLSPLMAVAAIVLSSLSVADNANRLRRAPTHWSYASQFTLREAIPKT